MLFYDLLWHCLHTFKNQIIEFCVFPKFYLSSKHKTLNTCLFSRKKIGKKKRGSIWSPLPLAVWGLKLRMRLKMGSIELLMGWVVMINETRSIIGGTSLGSERSSTINRKRLVHSAVNNTNTVLSLKEGRAHLNTFVKKLRT